MSYEKNNKLHIVAVNAMVRKNGRYLVLKRSEQEKAFPGAWCFPGGKIEGNDTVEKTLSNELIEEAGLALTSVGLMVRDTAFVRPDNQTVKVFTYLCDVKDGGIVLEHGSFTEAKWILPDELEKMRHTNLDEDIAAAEKLLGQFKD